MHTDMYTDKPMPHTVFICWKKFQKMFNVIRNLFIYLVFHKTCINDSPYLTSLSFKSLFIISSQGYEVNYWFVKKNVIFTILTKKVVSFLKYLTLAVFIFSIL